MVMMVCIDTSAGSSQIWSVWNKTNISLLTRRQFPSRGIAHPTADRVPGANGSSHRQNKRFEIPRSDSSQLFSILRKKKEKEKKQ